MSFGEDWTFEEQYRREVGGKVICFDHTVDMEFWMKRFRHHLRGGRVKRLVDFLRHRRFFVATAPCTCARRLGDPVREIIGRAEGRRAFLKIDIERWEYRILDELAELGAGVQGLVIEFHDVDLHRERIDRFLDGLNGLELVHIHGNNVGGYDANGDPLIVEMSFARPAAGWNAVAERTYPFEGLDYPNDPALPERPLRFRIDQASGGTPSRTR